MEVWKAGALEGLRSTLGSMGPIRIGCSAAEGEWYQRSNGRKSKGCVLEVVGVGIVSSGFAVVVRKAGGCAGPAEVLRRGYLMCIGWASVSSVRGTMDD